MGSSLDAEGSSQMILQYEQYAGTQKSEGSKIEGFKNAS